MMEIKRTIKYDADRVKGFGREIMSVAGCDQLPSCIQCGTCSGACPLSIYMDFSPRQVIALVRADFKNEVLRSNSIWLCASCYGCAVECPRQIRLIMLVAGLLSHQVFPQRDGLLILGNGVVR